MAENTWVPQGYFTPISGVIIGEGARLEGCKGVWLHCTPENQP